jgi:hypothetical protein
MDNSYWERRDEMFKEQLKVLATVLSPSELEEFRLRMSHSAEMLRVEVQYFNCTPEEFKLLLDGRENQRWRRNSRTHHAPSVERKVRA